MKETKNSFTSPIFGYMSKSLKTFLCKCYGINIEKGRAVDPHSLHADPDPAVFMNADPDLAEPNLKKKKS